MKKIIVVIALVFAFTLGTIFSADIATAVKPVTEVFVTNTEPIAVTGTVSTTSQDVISIRVEDGIITCPDESTRNVEPWRINWRNNNPQFLIEAQFNGGTISITIHRMISDGNTFQILGSDASFLTMCSPPITDDDLPWQYTITGDCSKEVGTIVLESDIGISGEFTGKTTCLVG